MKCRECGQEVLLAERCPYCGRPTGVTPGQGQAAGAQADAAGRVQGRFVGPLRRSRRPIEEEAGVAGEAGPARRLPLWEYVWRLFSYMADPTVSPWRKGLIAAGFIYVLFPLDLLPGLVLPGVGWLDDLLVLWVGLPALARELAAYVPGRRGRA